MTSTSAAALGSPTAAVFVCGSDNRRDILDRTLPSVQKFWPACRYPLFVGLNSSRYSLPIGVPVIAPPSDWRREFTQQLAQIDHEHIIVMLDDFLIQSAVNQQRLADLVDIAMRRNLDYLRLIPMGRPLLARVTGRRPLEIAPGIEPIRERHPFYSGLQIAIWRKQHLLTMLEQPQSIWDFERHCVRDTTHCAIHADSPIAYRHLVEKGRWLPYARSLLRRAGFAAELGDRPTWSAARYGQLFLDEVRWLVLGYATC